MSRLTVRKESSQWKAAGVSKVSWDCNQAGSIGWPIGLVSGIQGIGLKSTKECKILDANISAAFGSAAEDQDMNTNNFPY